VKKEGERVSIINTKKKKLVRRSVNTISKRHLRVGRRKEKYRSNKNKGAREILILIGFLSVIEGRRT